MKIKQMVFPFLILFCHPSFSQKVNSLLKFEQGQELEITTNIKTTINQEVMGQIIDFKVDATTERCYVVTNATDDNYTLKHFIKRIQFSFDGMGQKIRLDSKNEDDLKGQFGKPIKELLDKKYDMVIDPSGKTLMVLPEKYVPNNSDNRTIIIGSMMKGILDMAIPPQKGSNSFFKILPDKETGVGEPWNESYTREQEKFDAVYTISDINDSTIVVNFATSSVTVTKAEMMGNETSTTMNNQSTGKIILDRATGIIREKTETTESNGNTETSFGTLPVSSKTQTTVIVTRSK